ncbi:MAG TPA: tetratricopeptide repeat protein [Bryobacteraceae bacterium]|nr:tetratricopeptide repeat protein [Bryobacteraceae bacterium]
MSAAVQTQRASVVTFYKDIAPIVYHNCVPCHRPGESGPFPLLSYRDVKSHARQIADVTKQRYMPPWLPEPGYGNFKDELRLTEQQIDLIRRWVEQGALAGSPTDAPAMPVFVPGWQLGIPDLVVTVTKPYLLKPDGRDEFWNFVIRLPIRRSYWVKAIEIRPGNARVFHHANLLVDRSGSAQSFEKSPGAGFPGMDLEIGSDTFDPDSHFLFWKPGSEPPVEPDGMAWRIDRGTDLVLNVHLQPSGKPEVIQPSIGLYYTDHPQTKFPMLIQLEHDGALDIPAGDQNFLVSDDFRLPMDVDVLAVYPHAHYLGKLLEGYATLPDGTRKWLIRIPRWDLNWQAVYRYRPPVFLPKGTVISMRFHYDNSANNPQNPNDPPIRVHAGNNATDEMGHLWLQVLPRGDRDRRMELQAAIMQRRLEKYPNDFSAEFNLGALMLVRGDAAGALPYLEKAVAVRPDSAAAQTELGAALLAQRRLPEAIRRFRQALLSNPQYLDAQYDLAAALLQDNQWEAAIEELHKLLQERPQDAEARNRLVEALLAWAHECVASNRLETAVQCYREALEIRSKDADIHSNLGAALARLGRLTEAIPEFEAALAINPNLETARRNLRAAQSMLQSAKQ